MPTSPTDLEKLASALSPRAWEARLSAAREQALACVEALALVRAGSSRKAALSVVFPGVARSTASSRLLRYERGGEEGLIDRRLPKLRSAVVTPAILDMVRGMLVLDPSLRSPALCKALGRAGIEVAESTLREHLRAHGLTHPSGRPVGGHTTSKAVPLPLAGAELLKAVEEELGAVRALTEAMERHLGQLPAPEGEVLDDRAHRDERGRFLSSYNEPTSRTEPEQGGKFDSVERRRSEKDLRQMRVANSSFAARYRKDLALTWMPIVVDAPRWSVLKHWQGEHLATLVGVPYQPSTLDKHARELKLANAAVAAREQVASFWMSVEGEIVDAQTGAVVIYGDASTKPIWTRNFTRCTKVSKTGRVQPGTSTMVLHSGAGTPLIYRAFSGTASVPKHIGGLLYQYEKAAGEGTARRVVVLDRESHVVRLFKELDGTWLYIIPLKSNVTGPKAKFEEVSDWTVYGETQDEVCDGWLWLNDSRKGEAPLRVRVVGRRRHRSGKVAWYATNTPAEEFSGDDVLRLYFDRWPRQEHRFRDGNGRVGLDVHHGYGKKKVDNIAVIDKIEKLEGRGRRLEKAISKADEGLQALDLKLVDHREALLRVEEHINELEETEEAELAAGHVGSEVFQQTRENLRAWRKGYPSMKQRAGELEQRRADKVERQEVRRSKLERSLEEKTKLARKTKIFTVDVVLDEIMLAYKLTFMNLAAVLMKQYLGVRLELDTLIRSVLTLPGERVQTKTTETIRIYKQPRDPKTMEAVQRACERLTALDLSRGSTGKKRRLVFTLVDPPET